MKIEARAARIRLLFLDVDGTLTDGRLYFLPQGVARAFHTLDGFGIRQLIKNGVQVSFVTAAADDGILHRAKYLGISRAYVGVTDKLAVVRQVLQDESLSPEDAAYMGDDLPDLPPMQHVGFAVAPKTAAAAVLAAAHWTPSLPAGGGAVRELCDFIIAAQT